MSKHLPDWAYELYLEHLTFEYFKLYDECFDIEQQEWFDTMDCMKAQMLAELLGWAK